MASLGEALTHGAVVLDGGLATRLEATGHDLSDALWSARLLADSPEAIVSAHLDFLRAGASVLTTASYQGTVDGFARAGHSNGERLLRLSVELAQRAIAVALSLTDIDRPLWTAASVGPYGATLADGSEYQGDYGLSVGELVRFHRPRMEILASAPPDVLALETVPDVREAEALLIALDGLGMPAWLSYTIRGNRTAAGQPLTEAFALARGVDELVAVGVNCSSPEDVTAAVPLAAELSGKPVVVYPNSGERWDATARSWAGWSTLDTRAVTGWVADGARLIGGCCRVTPAHIATIAAHTR